jgi:uncharacterized protein YrrD
MDFHIHGSVRQIDGRKLGELRHVVLDPDVRHVISLVVQESGFDGHAVIVSADDIDSADGTSVYLSLSREQLDQLPRFAYGRNVAPPPADVDSEVTSSDQAQEPVDVPDVPPVGAAAGITSIGFTPIVEIRRNLPPDAIVVDDHTIVAATDGDIGHVRHVRQDDQTRQLTSFVVRKGFVFAHDVHIPIDWLAGVQGHRLMLRVDKRTVGATLPKER